MLPLLLAPLALCAQRAVQLGGQRFVPEQNLARSTRLPDAGRLGAALGGQRNALVQLQQLPSEADIRALAALGITLGDYLGGHAYYALVAEGATLPSLGSGNRLTALVPVQPGWKLCAALQPRSDAGQRSSSLGRVSPAESRIPEYARAGVDAARVVVRYAANATPAEVSSALARLGLRGVEVVDAFRAAYAEMPVAAAHEVAALPWVLAVDLIPAPPSLLNYQGRMLGRANALSTPASFGGRGLEGNGVRIGIWDANVTRHVDFGERVHVQEYEEPDSHGTHVTGTVLGAGLLNPDGKGMAPKAQAWAYNFNVQRNGLSSQQEMLQAREKWGITLTQNSYGIPVSYYCSVLNRLTYSVSDYNLDLLTTTFPTLTHVFAAGNDGTSCSLETEEVYGKPRYGTASTRAKNAIHVGAVNLYGEMSEFSSWGPQDDGRLFPTLCAKGVDVLSTMPGNGYKAEDGTSMACPTVSGTAALITERYAQLNQGRELPSALLRGLLANTATDAGRPGPDFQYGYGIMNAERAVVALENAWYLADSLQHGMVKNHTINIPKGCQGLRVMLVWNDPVVAKSHAFRERALVNDLDLVTTVGTTDYLPWVCDTARNGLENNASRSVDHLNNIEQVTLTAEELAGATQVTVTVKGSEIPTQHQDYTLVWYLEEGEPRVVSPANGDLCTPGGDCYLAVENVAIPYTIDLSYDGGTSWQPIGQVSQQYFNLTFGLPSDAPLTENALIRVVDSRGKVAKSLHPFVIAPQPKGLKLVQSECSTSGWRLTWEKNEAATEGYVVLRANPDKDESFEKIGETGPDITGLDIPSEQIEGIERPVFTVAAKLPGGANYGKRAVGVLATYSAPVRLTAADLPFVESFAKYPSRFFVPRTGENVDARYVNRNYTDITVSNLFGLVCTKECDNFNSDNYFDKSRNASNTGTFTLCDLDLTGIPAGQKVLLHIYGSLAVADENDLSTAQMRVKAGAHGDQILTNLEGKEKNIGGLHNQDWCYLLGTGQRHKVVIEFVGKGARDLLGIMSIAVEQPVNEAAVSLAFTNIPSNGPNLGNEAFGLMVENRSASPLENVVVKAYRGEQWVASATVDRLAGMASREVTINVDLSTKEELGELIPLRFACEVNPLVPMRNSEIRHTVNSMGRIIPMGTTTYKQSGLGIVPVDPKKTYTVTDRAVFTDNGGALGSYSDDQESTLKFLPGVEGMKVRLRFIKFKTTERRAQLLVYTTQVPSSLKRDGLRYYSALMGEVVGQKDRSQTFVSEAEDGGLTVYFESISGSENDGWVAEVDLVPNRNPLALLEATAQLVDTNGGDEAEVPVRVKLLNRWQTPMTGVEVAVFARNRYQIVQTIDTLQPGVTELTLNEKLRVPLALPMRYQVVVEGDDTDARDNEKTIYALYDRYCIPSALPTNGIYPEEVQTYDKKQYGERNNFGVPNYTLDPPLPLYKADGTVPLRVTPSGQPADWSVGVWVDWNDDFQFARDERVAVTLTPMGTDPVDVPLKVDDKPTGIHRVRVVVAPTEEVANPCAAITKGSLQDFAVEVAEGHYPTHGDLSLVKLDIGKSGLRLSQEQPIKVTIANLSEVGVNSKVPIKVTIDGVEYNEEIDFTGIAKLAPYTGKRQVTLQLKADLSGAGLHTVTAELVGNPLPENNTKTSTVYCTVPEPNGFYALSFKSLGNGQEMLNAKDVGKLLNSGNEWTLEMLFRSDYPQFATLMQSDGFRLWTSYSLTGGIPDNAIVVRLGTSMIRWTPANSIEPGKWHHLTIAVSGIAHGISGRTCNPKIYIDGVEQPLAGNGLEDAPTFGSGWKPALFVCPEFDWQLKLLRTNKIALGIADIKPFAYVQESDGTLPTGYTSEFTFSEGPKNKQCFSGNGLSMELLFTDPKRLNAPKDGLWMPITKLIGGFRFAGLAKVEKTPNEENSYTLTFDKGTDRTKVTGSVVTAWPGVTLTHKGQAVNDDTEFDFTNPVVIVAKADNLFGHSLTQTVTCTFAEDRSKECKLLSLKLEASKNPGITKDQMLTSISAVNRLQIPSTDGALTQAERAVLTFTVSEGAKLRCRGVEVASGTTEVDLSAGTILTVEAANGTTKEYELAVSQSQTLEWELSSTHFTYGDTPVDAGAVASSGLPVHFTSTNAAVGSVANGRLAIGTPGETTLTATQPGQGVWNASAPITKKIAVGKKAITVQAKAKKYTAGESIHVELAYNGLVNPEDVRSLPDPFALRALALENTSAALPLADGFTLPVGVYSVKANASNAYESDYYSITPTDGEFEVVQGNLWQVAITVREGANAVENASVILGRELKNTGRDGVSKWYLPEGKRYTLTVGKAGYSAVPVVADLTTGQNLNLVAELKPASIDLTYSVDGAGGMVVGPVKQTVAPGASGQPVFAQPESGYRFAGWSDGSNENPHIAINVTEPKVLKATFTPILYTLTYRVGNGGKFKDPNKAIQQVMEGQDGEEIAVEPADNAHYFMGWSDGLDASKRVDTVVKGNREVEALFGTFGSLSESNSFDNGLGNGWYTLSKARRPRYWEVAQGPVKGMNPLQGGFAASIVNSTPGDGVESYLYSPCYRLANSWNSELTVSFDYVAPGVQRYQYRVEMKVNDGEWESFMELSATKVAKFAKKTVVASKLTAGGTVQFRWRHKSAWAKAVGLDNVVIAPPSTAKVKVKYLAIPADAGSFHKLQADGTPSPDAITEQEVVIGQKPSDVVAIPSEGHVFSHWDDASTNPELKGQHEARAEGVRTAYFTDPSLVTVSYRVTPVGAGTVQVEGTDVQAQTLPKGADAKPAIAIANAGYRFSHWDGTIGGIDEEITPKAVEEDIELVATFEQIPEGMHGKFQVVDTLGNPIEGATIEIAGETLHTGSDGAISTSKKLEPNDYGFTVDKHGYLPYEGVLKLSRTSSSTTVVLLPSQHPTVTFSVTDANGGTAIDAATIEINGQTLTTDASGKANINLPNGSYPYTVKKDGYEDKAGSITVNGDAVEVAIALTKKGTQTYTITFTVRDAQPQPLDNAAIEIAGKTIKTDAKGVASIDLPNGAYPYTVTLEGYRPANGTAQVQGKAQGIPVTLVKEVFNAVESSLLAGVEVYPNPCDAELHLRNVAALRSLRVVNALGQTVLTRSHDGAETMAVATDTLPAGLYLLHLTDTAGAIRTLRFAKR